MIKTIREIKAREFIPRFLISSICIFIMALNYNLFFLRHDIVSGGVSGVATIAHGLLNITPGTTILVFNILMIVVSYLLLGPKTTGHTIIGSIMYPIFVGISYPIATKLYAYTSFSELIVVVLISGFIYGFFNGMIYRMDYSTGGMDTLILIVNKYFKISTGAASLIVNVIIIILGAFLFGIEKAAYGIIIIIMNTTLINKIQLGISDSKMFYITTQKTESIKKFLEEMHAGYTFMKTEGGHSSKNNDMIMCVVPTTSYYMFRKAIMSIDPEAFIVINDCYEVYGGQLKERFPFI